MLHRDVQLAALLLYHAKLSSHSEWNPWIQALPTQFNTLLHWSEAQLAELQLGSTATELDFLSQASFADVHLLLYYVQGSTLNVVTCVTFRVKP